MQQNGHLLNYGTFYTAANISSETITNFWVSSLVPLNVRSDQLWSTKKWLLSDISPLLFMEGKEERTKVYQSMVTAWGEQNCPLQQLQNNHYFKYLYFYFVFNSLFCLFVHGLHAVCVLFQKKVHSYNSSRVVMISIFTMVLHGCLAVGHLWLESQLHSKCWYGVLVNKNWK